MDNFEKRMGVFPSLMEPAHRAATKVLQEGLDRAELEGKPGFWVVPRDSVAHEDVFHNFEHDGTWFSIVEQEDMS